MRATVDVEARGGLLGDLEERQVRERARVLAQLPPQLA